MSGKKPKAKLSIADQIRDVEAENKTDTKDLKPEQVTKVASEVKTYISSMVQTEVEGVFDTKKNKDFWEEQAKVAKEKPVGWFNAKGYVKSRLTNADNTSDAVKTALGGGKSEQASKLIGDAVAEGVIQTFKGMSDAEITKALENPSGEAKALADKIATKTFATDDWETIEENINKSKSLGDDKAKASVIEAMKKSVTLNIEKMITDKSDDIKQIAPLKNGLMQVRDKVKELNTVALLNKNNDEVLSYDEVKFLDKNNDRTISAEELAALPDEMRQEFAKIMAKEQNQALVKKTDGTNEIDFSVLDKIPQGNKSGLQIN